jgi:hypothetical protein
MGRSQLLAPHKIRGYAPCDFSCKIGTVAAEGIQRVETVVRAVSQLVPETSKGWSTVKERV